VIAGKDWKDASSARNMILLAEKVMRR